MYCARPLPHAMRGPCERVLPEPLPSWQMFLCTWLGHAEAEACCQVPAERSFKAISAGGCLPVFTQLARLPAWPALPEWVCRSAHWSYAAQSPSEGPLTCVWWRPATGQLDSFCNGYKRRIYDPPLPILIGFNLALRSDGHPPSSVPYPSRDPLQAALQELLGHALTCLAGLTE
jgi:hypothetical protein